MAAKKAAAKDKEQASGTETAKETAPDFMAMMSKASTAVNDSFNPHNDVVRITRSPSVNFSFANGHGLPRGYSIMVYGPNKGGKSMCCYDTIGALHEDSPTAFAIRYNTELRERLQLTPERKRVYGIDERRYKCFETNVPSEIFDHFEQDIASYCAKGMDLRLAIIDSTSNIQGRRAEKAESIDKFQIGDHAQTLQIGLQRILPVIRKYRIALILVTHVRAEMDQTLIKRAGGGGPVVKPQASWALRHFAEYFAFIDRDDTAKGKQAEDGTSFVDSSLLDMKEGENVGELTGNMVRWTMKESSCGPRGRTGRFAMQFANGIVNVNQELFVLATKRGVITTNGSHYAFGDKKWKGKDPAFEAMLDRGLQREVMAELRRRDMQGEWMQDEVDTTRGPDAVDAILFSEPAPTEATA